MERIAILYYPRELGYKGLINPKTPNQHVFRQFQDTELKLRRLIKDS